MISKQSYVMIEAQPFIRATAASSRMNQRLSHVATNSAIFAGLKSTPYRMISTFATRRILSLSSKLAIARSPGIRTAPFAVRFLETVTVRHISRDS